MKTTRIVEHEHGYVHCPYCEATIIDVAFEQTQIKCNDCRKEIRLI